MSVLETVGWEGLYHNCHLQRDAWAEYVPGKERVLASSVRFGSESMVSRISRAVLATSTKSSCAASRASC